MVIPLQVDLICVALNTPVHSAWKRKTFSSPSRRTVIVIGLRFLFHDESGEMLKGSVVGLLGVRRKEATGNLPTGEVRANAIATETAFAARIRTGAVRLVFFDFAFHRMIS